MHTMTTYNKTCKISRFRILTQRIRRVHGALDIKTIVPLILQLKASSFCLADSRFRTWSWRMLNLIYNLHLATYDRKKKSSRYRINRSASHLFFLGCEDKNIISSLQQQHWLRFIHLTGVRCRAVLTANISNAISERKGLRCADSNANLTNTMFDFDYTCVDAYSRITMSP